MDIINLVADTDIRGAVVAVEGQRQMHFPTIDDLTDALMRSSINPFRYRFQLAFLEKGIPVGLMVTSAQLGTFWSH